ncbi:MAG: alkaline phosphatase family protein [Tepidisphaeraceae bacterium]
MGPQQLQDAFTNGTLVRPSDQQPSLVHLVRAIATLAGVPDLDPGAGPTNQLAKLIGPSDHLVFVLLDGLGMNLIERLPTGSFLASHLRREIHATCPSTTACALTTVTTAQYPNRHGVTGWFTHLPEFDLTAMILPFAERFSNQPLARRDIAPEDVLPLPPIAPRMTHRPLSLTPAYITNTVYNTYARGGTRGVGYRTLSDAIDQTIAHVSGATVPTYTHLYLHDIDTLCHHVGIGHDSVLPLILGIDAELDRLAKAVGTRARIVVSADHGLIDVPKPDQSLLLVGDPMLDLLMVPPSGDARMPIFHLRPGQRDAFTVLFGERFGDGMILLETSDAERLQLFGPGPMSDVARRRFGDFIAFPPRAATLSYHPPHKPLGELYLAVHGGLSPEEMRVPLCIA